MPNIFGSSNTDKHEIKHEEHTRENIGGSSVKYDEKHKEKSHGGLHGGETKIEHKEKKVVSDSGCRRC